MAGGIGGLGVGLFLLFLIGIGLWRMTIEIRLQAVWPAGGAFRGAAEIRLFGGRLTWRRAGSPVGGRGGDPADRRSLGERLQAYRGLGCRLRPALRAVRVTAFRWSTVVGTGDAAETALAAAALYQLKAAAWVGLHRLVRLEAAPRLRVRPAFQAPIFTTEVECIARVRFGEAMLAALKIAFDGRGRRDMHGQRASP
ncbi:MAG: hypothetical protein HSCHL_1788 [Hydrogenibacillus schlegelii]|uniref:DUF2953 domain-containing protein n=1 Tax=Hydrogenibacillus schlegelii TaxID=1484 RepID=A0A2T5GFA3_HYDSH|nr:DUF2953 domain-containing protein [Hydrogenibacillus schlegelii]PTQ54845.1 MAG: hypothetical protein HSCHL_1788 [Hydrogenibacillus schlegelii]